MSELIVRIMADGLVIPVVLLAIYALLFRLKTKHWLTSYLRLLAAGLTAYLLAKIIGHFFQPEMERPFQQLGQNAGAAYMNNPGFPSDHVLFCVAIFWAVLCESRAKWVAVTIGILTVLVALGRVLALVHTPLDVFGGVAIASIGALWYTQTGPNNIFETASRILRKKRVK